jgi:hypothetical protein
MRGMFLKKEMNTEALRTQSNTGFQRRDAEKQRNGEKKGMSLKKEMNTEALRTQGNTE